MSAHTPGPWAAAGHIVYAGEFRVATVQAVGAKASRDAELIAAAPDMKAALNALVVNYAQTGRVTDDFVRAVARLMEGLD